MRILITSSYIHLNSASTITVDELRKVYEAIRELAGNFYIDYIDSIVAEIKKRRIPKEEEVRFDVIENAVRNVDWNELEKAL